MNRKNDYKTEYERRMAAEAKVIVSTIAIVGTLLLMMVVILGAAFVRTLKGF